MHIGPGRSPGPTVSVIIPCFNLGEYVEEAVDSVLNQTRRDFEIIVVDDGSTDLDTRRTLAALDRPQTTVYRTPNRGLAAARNFAIHHARGQFVCALDADDRLRPEFLERTIPRLESDPQLAFVSTWVRCFGLEEWTWKQERCDFPTLLGECVVLTAAPMRRSAIDEIGLYDESPSVYGAEDWDLWISLVERGWQGTIVPEVLFDYRQRAGSMRRETERGESRLRFWRYLVEKHQHSYRAWLPDVLVRMEDECGRVLLENWMLQREIDAELLPAIAQRRPTGHEAEDPAAAIERLRVELALTRDEAAAARREVAALRDSASWRVTAPLRSLYEVWLALRRRASPPHP